MDGLSWMQPRPPSRTPSKSGQPSRYEYRLLGMATLRPVLLVLAAIAGVGAVSALSPQAAPSPDARAKNLQNIKQVALATLMYASDWDDRFPAAKSRNGVMLAVNPYLKDLKTFKIEGGELRFDFQLSGTLWEDVKNLKDRPMYWAKTSITPDPYLVAFTDGHCKYIAEDYWKSLAKKYKIKE